MDDTTRERLLARFAAGTLDEADRRTLFDAALEDQALFDTLGDEDMLKDLLEPAASRRAVLERLARPRRRSPLVRWTAPLAVAAALAVAVLGVRLMRPGGTDLLEAAGDPGPVAGILWTATDGIPPSKALAAPAASFDLGVETLRSGDRLPLSAAVSETVWASVLLMPPKGGPRLLLPREGGPWIRQEAGPLPLGALLAPREPGHYRLRLTAVRTADAGPPPDGAALLTRLATGDATLIDVSFDVAP
jgi:hypothetical protein